MSLEGTLFNIAHEGSARIIAEHERRVAEIEVLRAKDGSNAQQLDQLIAQFAEHWDLAERTAALARSMGSNELFELFVRYGARDFRSIGHKAIYVANAWRTLNCVGWQYAEPVLRSLAYALLAREGTANPGDSDLPADRPGRKNMELAGKLRTDWQAGKIDSGATHSLLETIYGGDTEELCNQVVEVINSGVSPQSVWDALLVGAGELLMRQPGIVGIHTLTSTNALRYAFDACGDNDTRKLLLLQNAAFLPLFRKVAPRGAEAYVAATRDAYLAVERVQVEPELARRSA